MNRNNIHTNRLINEKSPYLLQHAHNPVDWYPWSNEAFEKARKEDKPIFLSVGYSTCHWCHVMERESFEDDKVAKILNENFVSIKVDREERPDIDSIYMTFCQTLTGHGGWPLTVFLTPDKKPFYAGTYFPKKGRYGYPGLVELLDKIGHLWKENKDEVIESSEEILEAVRNINQVSRNVELVKDDIHNTFKIFRKIFDEEYGGFGDAPKFPTSHNLSFLLRYWSVTGEKKALDMVEKTLEAMYKGGIFDHIGFGFARYSTDEKWLVPHFEKMLYDNALLTIAYIEAYQAIGKELYREVAEKIIEYINRDMTSEEGGFYSALDADSEGVEGKFYVWSIDEIKEVLNEEEIRLFSQYYDITDEGNFEGKNIPNLINQDLEEIQNDNNLRERFNSIREKLFKHREKRIHPYRDDKILTSWNGLMIAAMAYAGRVLDNEQYIQRAERALDFIFKNLIRDDGRLLARYRDGEAAYPAYLDDYAFLVWGLIETYEATLDVKYLRKAVKLNEDMIKLFWDEKEGGFFLYGKDSEELIMRPKEVYDGAMPSGNSVATMNIMRLSKILGDEKLGNILDSLFKTFGGDVKANPHGHSHFMMAFLYNTVQSREVVIAGSREDHSTKEMVKEYNKRFLPFATLVLNDGNDELFEIVPFIRNQNMIDDNVTAYVCERFLCNEPTTDINKFKELLDRKSSLE